ncbi:MAG: hypothetical protein ACRDKJ_07225 [Actinomycetota bacterium]
MPVSVITPTETRLVEVCASRTTGPARWTMDTPQRCDRVRAGIVNSGLALPTGDIRVWVKGTESSSEAFDLPAALGVLLADPAHRHLRRPGLIAWGALRLDGSASPAEEPFVNELPAGPCVGRVWDPDDRVPSPDDDALISLVGAPDLLRAWDVVVFLAAVSTDDGECLEGTGGLPDPDRRLTPT